MENEPLRNKTSNTRKTSTGWMVKRLGYIMDNAMKNELAPHGLSIQQFIILMCVGENECSTQATLGKITNFPKYAISRNLDALESMNYLERLPDKASRRSFRINLTGNGRALLPKLFKAVKKVNESVLTPLSTKEQRELTKLLGKLM